VNNVVQEHDNIVTFLSPIGKGKYPLYVNVANPVVNGVFTSDGTNSNAIANANLKFNGSLLDVTGRIQTTGTIIPGAYAPGQTIKTTMIDASGLLTLDIAVTGSTPVDKTIATYRYTPVSSNSQIIIDFCAKYSVEGASNDATDYLTSLIDISGIPVATAYQNWVKGGSVSQPNELGTRSGTIFPLMGAYKNSDTLPKLISVSVNGTNDRPLIVNDGGIWLRITEIGR